RIDDAARVRAQVEHEAAQRLVTRLQLAELLAELGAGVFLELRDAQVRVARLEHARRHARDLDQLALERELERRGLAVALQRQRDRAARQAAQALDRV